MPKAKKDSVSDIAETVTETPSVMADLENIVQKAVAAAVEVIRQEFSQRLSMLEARLETVEAKLVDMESTGICQSSVDDQILAKELEVIKRMSRDSALQANDNEQYSRRNNLRIKGLKLKNECTSQECTTAVVEFFRTQMHCRVDADNIDIAHLVKPKVVSVPDGDQRRSRNGVLQPTVLVRFHSRTMRDSIIRERKILKGSKYAVSEDLTTLNVQTINHMNKNDLVQKTWSWNGKLFALLKNDSKLLVRPFQTLQECVVC